MAKHPKVARHTVLSDTATYDSKSGDLRAVIETPRGSRNKFRYDPQCDCFELATALPEGMSFPFDYGFVPSTLGDDALGVCDTPEANRMTIPYGNTSSTTPSKNRLFDPA